MSELDKKELLLAICNSINSCQVSVGMPLLKTRLAKSYPANRIQQGFCYLARMNQAKVCTGGELIVRTTAEDFIFRTFGGQYEYPCAGCGGEKHSGLCGGGFREI